MKKKLVGYLLLFGIGLAFVPLMGLWRGMYSAADAAELLKALCDCFTVPAMVYLLLGLLLWCGKGGAFDMLGYGTKMFFSVFSREKRGEKESFYEYRQRKQKSPRPIRPFLIAGAAFLIVAVALLIAFYSVR